MRNCRQETAVRRRKRRGPGERRFVALTFACRGTAGPGLDTWVDGNLHGHGADPRHRNRRCVGCRAQRGHRALSALERGRPTDSVERLQIALPYELAVNGLTFNHYLGGLHSGYVRGARRFWPHTGIRKWPPSFRRFCDLRGIVGADPIGALAHLQLGRTFALAGDRVKAKLAYGDFLTLWKDADSDSDIPILEQGPAEYARLP